MHVAVFGCGCWGWVTGLSRSPAAWCLEGWCLLVVSKGVKLKEENPPGKGFTAI